MSDPKLAADNLAESARSTGNADFLFQTQVVGILQKGGRVSGVKVRDRYGDVREIEAPVVVNAAGPHSSQITELAFLHPNGPENDMRLSTRAMRQEVAYVNAPHGWREHGMLVTDFDTGIYVRPEGKYGEKILIGSIEPECDAEFHRWYDGFGDANDPDVVMPGGAESGFTDQWTNQVGGEFLVSFCPHRTECDLR